MNAKNQILAQKSKRKMRQTLHDEKKGGSSEEHFFHTHKVPIEPVEFFHASEVTHEDEGAASTDWKAYAGELIASGKSALEEGREFLKENGAGSAREIASTGMAKVTELTQALKGSKVGRKLVKAAGKLTAKKKATPRKAHRKAAAPKAVAHKTKKSGSGARKTGARRVTVQRASAHKRSVAQSAHKKASPAKKSGVKTGGKSHAHRTSQSH